MQVEGSSKDQERMDSKGVKGFPKVDQWKVGLARWSIWRGGTLATKGDLEQTENWSGKMALNGKYGDHQEP